MWECFGFRHSPYLTDPVPASKLGDQILVGRDRELKELEDRLLAFSNNPTIEGDNGVGKTSILAVLRYRLRAAFDEGRPTGIFFPLNHIFQLDPNDSPDAFIKKVYYRIASTIVEEHDVLKKRVPSVPNVKEVKSWLGSPLVNGWGVSTSTPWGGGGFTRSPSVNTSAGFSDLGFMQTIDEWLLQLFPSNRAGGFVCIIDNLELLETTQNARNLLEALRDTLLNRRGLRWILCGARGIVRTSASSPRLEGRLSEPMEVVPISDAFVSAAIERRIGLYGLNQHATAPVGTDSFQYLYDVLYRNLRNAFKYAEEFSFWLHSTYPSTGTRVTEDYDDLFQVWLTDIADKHHNDTDVGNRAWAVFDHLAGNKGWCSPSDFASYGFNSTAAMRTHIRALERENLVITSLNDDSDKRRKTIMMTPRGWLVRYARNGYVPPTPHTLTHVH